MDNTLSTEATDWREGRRFRAFELNQEGCSQQRIAEALGVSKGMVSQWMKRARDGGGVEALKCRPAPGARPRLSEKQRMKLPELLARGELRLMAFEESYGRARGWLVSDPKGVWGKLSFCPIHRGGAVKDFLASGAASRLQLEQLPGYAADLNPDEGIWKHLKWVELKNLCSVRASLS
jgi:transposase